MTAGPRHPSARGYHHGHLAEALLEAGVELARTGGPAAVVLREAARRVGVSATAAYRHFDSQPALLDAVRQRALQQLAAHLRAAGVAARSADGGRISVSRLEAIGRAYLEFALTERGLFQTFCLGLPMSPDVDLPADVDAFGVLTDALQEMSEQGLLAPELAASAPIAAWATVHGLAVLCLDGPLADLSAADRDPIFRGALQMVLSGLLPRT